MSQLCKCMFRLRIAPTPSTSAITPKILPPARQFSASSLKSSEPPPAPRSKRSFANKNNFKATPSHNQSAQSSIPRSNPFREPRPTNSPTSQVRNRPARPPIALSSSAPPENLPGWALHRRSIKKQFPDGWDPPRKLSREAMNFVRALHQHSPQQFTVPALAERFRISPEAVTRILKSKFVMSEEENERREKRRRERKEAERQARGDTKSWGSNLSGERKETEDLDQRRTNLRRW
ncbi:hypothetical protein T439DRAFT_383513 [Meredithblackwellia eburnea MCA 4105]